MILKDKLALLKTDGVVLLYDKKLVLALSNEIRPDQILAVEQCESCFICKLATNRQIQLDYKRMGLSNNNIELKKYLEEVKIIWK